MFMNNFPSLFNNPYLTKEDDYNEHYELRCGKNGFHRFPYNRILTHKQPNERIATMVKY